MEMKAVRLQKWYWAVWLTAVDQQKNKQAEGAAHITAG
jgi:hypothetical protein